MIDTILTWAIVAGWLIGHAIFGLFWLGFLIWCFSAGKKLANWTDK